MGINTAYIEARLGPLETTQDAERWAILFSLEHGSWVRRLFTVWTNPNDRWSDLWRRILFGWVIQNHLVRIQAQLPPAERRRRAELIATLFNHPNNAVWLAAVVLCEIVGGPEGEDLLLQCSRMHVGWKRAQVLICLPRIGGLKSLADFDEHFKTTSKWTIDWWGLRASRRYLAQRLGQL